MGQTRKIDSPEVLKALLAMPAPTPRVVATPVPTNLVVRDPHFFDLEKVPPDDAPIEDLLEYWERWSENADRDPSDTVRKRLFEVCLSRPKLLTTYLNFLPDTDSTLPKVKDLYDKAQGNEQFDKDWHAKVRRWLLFNSTYFLDELIALANKTKDNDRGGDIEKEEALVALADVSWTNAEPLLRNLMASGQPRATALAVSLFYEHAVEEKDTTGEERYRRELQAIASNRQQPAYARDTAIQSLSSNEWSGRDEWYLSLFKDETLLDMSDGEYTFTPLEALFYSDPEKWIPVMTRLAESKDPSVRSAAAACLLLVEGDELRKKALLPLLPWLTNPLWANDSSNGRLRLIQILGGVNIPESVPGLISVVASENPDDGYARGHAAESLSRYQDPRAAPALKKAFAMERDEGNRQRIMKGLLASHGMTDAEQLAALEEFATKMSTPEGREEMLRFHGPQEEPLPASLSIGRYLGQSRESPPESLVNAVLVRADELKSENPAVANALLEITHQWQGRQIELDIIRRIRNGGADAPTIIEALGRRDRMLPGLRVELEGLSSLAGAAQAVGAVVLGDPVMAQAILNSEDQPAQIALLACSRLSQTPLPVELVGPLLRHKNPLLMQAAETYLLAEDSSEARELLWQRHPNKAFVTGWREAIMYGGSDSFQAMVQSEEKLRAELLKENGPIEILAIVHNHADHGMFLRIYPDKAVYTEHEDVARYRERTISKAEVSALKDFLTTQAYADRGPTVQFCHHGCMSFELLMLTKEKGRRVFTQGEFPDWLDLRQQFSQLGTGDGAKIHYKLEEQIKGLQVLYAGELTVNDVAQQGGELRVYVERAATKEEDEERTATFDSEEDDDEALRVERVRRRVEITNRRFSWRVFANGNLDAVTSQPDGYATIDPARFVSADSLVTDWEDDPLDDTHVISPDSIVTSRNYEGLWRHFAGAKPVRLGSEDATYAHARVTRDGKWVVVSKTESEDGSGTYIVRLNLQTGREFRVNLPPADNLTPYASVPSLNKIVLRRARDEYVAPGNTPKGPNTAEYYLLDPATGVTRLVTGDFTPLREEGTRFLQPAEEPDEFWAAVSNEEKNHTQIGRYSVKNFSFKPVMIVPQLIFNSMQMWVDASKAKVYVVYKGQLLRFPLQASAN